MFFRCAKRFGGCANNIACRYISWDAIGADVEHGWTWITMTLQLILNLALTIIPFVEYLDIISLSFLRLIISPHTIMQILVDFPLLPVRIICIVIISNGRVIARHANIWYALLPRCFTNIIPCTVITLLPSSMSQNFNPSYLHMRRASRRWLPCSPIFFSSHCSIHNLRIRTGSWGSLTSSSKAIWISLQNASIFWPSKSSSSHNLPAADCFIAQAWARICWYCA